MDSFYHLIPTSLRPTVACRVSQAHILILEHLPVPFAQLDSTLAWHWPLPVPFAAGLNTPLDLEQHAALLAVFVVQGLT